MSDQMPIVFLPSGISRIEDNLVDDYYHHSHGYSLKEKKRASHDGMNNGRSPGNGVSSDTEIADDSEDFLPEMSVDDDDDDQYNEETVLKTKGISPTPSNSSGAGANAKTLKVYQSHVRVFKDWLKLEGLPTDFEYCSAEELSSWLKKFYRDGKRKDGQQWKPSSLKIFRFAINQHLNNDPYNRSISITKDPQFKEANNVIKERQKELIQLGEDATGTRESREGARPMTAEDVRQLFQKNIIGVSNPKALHRYVFMILGINFGITTRLALHLLKPTMLDFKIDENSGLSYVLYDPKKDKESLNKTISKPKRKLYGVPGNPLCPITALKLYIQKRNPECTEAFFHTPNRHYKETGVWYTPQATGKNTLGRLMKDIATDASLCFPYTNNSLRYTPPYIFTPPDPRTTTTTTTYRISNDKIATINGDTSNTKPLFMESSYNLLSIRPKGEVDGKMSAPPLTCKPVFERPLAANTNNATSSERIPLLYPPLNNGYPAIIESTPQLVKRTTYSTEDSYPPRGPLLVDSHPKTAASIPITSTTRSIKAHHVLCVAKQWEMDDIMKAINAGDAIILSKQGIIESSKPATASNGHHGPDIDTSGKHISPISPKVKDEYNDEVKTMTASQKLASRPGRKQLEPKRIRPGENEVDDIFQIEVTYDDAVTSIQANLTLIQQLQKNYPPSRQTIDELFKIRKTLDSLLNEY